MRSITLNMCRSICINQNIKHDNKYGAPCSDCPIIGICMLFVDYPINWSKYAVEVIDEESSTFYKLKKVVDNA